MNFLKLFFWVTILFTSRARKPKDTKKLRAISSSIEKDLLWVLELIQTLVQ
jgi:hypothetical protein